MSGPQQRLNVEQLLRHAVDLINQERWPESLAAHYKLIDLSPNFPLAHYGMGVTQFKLGENQSAKLSFEKGLSLDPSHANSHFYLGEIFLAERRLDLARQHFRAALQLNSHHGAALNRLRTLEAPQVQPIPQPPPRVAQPQYAHPAHAGHQPQFVEPAREVHQPQYAPPPSDNEAADETQEFGVFGVLKQDQSPISREAIGLIEQLTMKRRPRMSAFIGRLFATVVFFTILGAVLGTAVGVAVFRAPELGIVGALAALVFGWLLLLISIKSTSYLLDQGRLAVTTGILFKRTHNFELYRVVDLELRQTFLNRLTRDGTLILFVEGVHGAHDAHPVHLRGLAKRRELELIFKRLRSLVMLLRSHPYIKGIIR